MRRALGHNANGSGQSEPPITSSQILELKKNIRLTINQLRKFDGLQDISEAEAIEITEALFMHSQIMYDIYSQIKSKENDTRIN